MDFEMSFVVLTALKAFLFSVNLSPGSFFFFFPPMTLKASGLEFAYDPVINSTEFFVFFSPYNLFALLFLRPIPTFPGQ